MLMMCNVYLFSDIIFIFNTPFTRQIATQLIYHFILYININRKLLPHEILVLPQLKQRFCPVKM